MTQAADHPEFPPSPPQPGVAWLDLRTASKRSGLCEGALRHKLGDWVTRGLARQAKPTDGIGGRSVWLVREDADPRFARVKSVEILDSEFDARTLTDAQRAELLFRKRAVEGWRLACAAGVKSGTPELAVTADYIARLQEIESRTVSRATLYNWFTAYRAKGLGGLVDCRWQSTPSGRSASKDGAFPDFYDELKRLWLDQRRRSKQLCYDRAADLAGENGWPVPSYRAASRILAGIPRKTAELHRLGQRKYDATTSPFIERDYTRIVIGGIERPMQSNDVWCADHHQFDVWVKVPGREKPTRPWLCGWQDIRSRKLVGFAIVPDAPDSATIIAALRHGLIDCGTPLIALTDNGKDFDSFALQGITKKQRRQHRTSNAEPRTPNSGVLGMLGVEVRHAREYNAKSKPIERFFGTLCGRFSKLWDTYCGSDPKTRPEQLTDPRQRERTLAKAPDFQAFCDSFPDWLAADYHTNPHAGHGMDGQSPAHVYQRELVVKRPVDSRLLDSLTLRRTPPLKVGRNGVTWMKLTWGRVELADRMGEFVCLAIDDRDMQQAQVYTPEGKFLCLAACNERLPFMTSHDELKVAIGESKADRKTRRDYIEKRPRLADSLPDRTYRRRQRQAQPSPLPEDGGACPAPPSFQPVRTPLDDQLPAIRQAMEAVPLRLAAGAESIDQDVLRSALASLARQPEPDEDTFAVLSRAMRIVPSTEESA